MPNITVPADSPNEQYEVRVVFVRTHAKHGTFRDAMVFPVSEWMQQSAAERQNRLQARYAEWVRRVEEQPVEPGA